MATLQGYNPAVNPFLRDVNYGGQLTPRSRRRGSRVMQAQPWSMDIDCMDGDKEYVVVCDLPGISKDKVEVHLENNMLTIRATKEKPDIVPEDGRARINEIGLGHDERSVPLPLSVNQDEAKCCFRDGMLCVKFPKLVGHSTTKNLEIQS